MSKQDRVICYSANALCGKGGQGEFLRQMVFALNHFSHGRVLSRGAQSNHVQCIDLPNEGWRHKCFRTIQSLPWLRRRRGLLTLIDDVDFDSKASKHVTDVKLFDGVMAQCSHTFEVLSRKRIPLVLTALNTHIEDFAGAIEEEERRLQVPAPRYIHPYMKCRVQREIERATFVRVVSELARGSFINRGVPAEKIEVVLPAIDLDHFRPVPRQDNVFRVLAVLSIDARKGAYYLLEAFEKAAIPNSELVIIGATGDRWSRRMLQGFTSRLKNIRVQSADVVKAPISTTYGSASVLVHPAIEDGFALAVAQALACGKPVISTRQTGAAQLITDGGNGYVLECRDVDGLVDRLRLLAKSPALLDRLSLAAPGAVADLGYPAFAQNVAQLYKRAIA